MTNYRCKYNQVWDSNTRRYRTCKNKRFFTCYCVYHSRQKYNKYIIKIQSLYKGYYIRKKLKIYYKLPRDLQRKIIWHVNTNLYVKQFNSSISKIIYKRSKIFYNIFKVKIIEFQNYNLLHSSIIGSLHFYISFENCFVYDLLSLIKLILKYEKIIDIYKIYEIKKLIFVTKILYFSNYIYNDIYNHQMLNRFNKLVI